MMPRVARNDGEERVRVLQHAGAGDSAGSRPARAIAAIIGALTLAACVAGDGSRGPRGGSKRGEARAATPAPPADPRDLALLRRMTLREKVNQLMQFSAGPATGPDSAGRPRGRTLEDLAREGIGSFMWFTHGAADINRMQRIAVTESRLGIPIVFAFDILHGYWTTFPVPLGIAATWDAGNARTMARIAGLEGYAGGQRWTFAPMLDHPVHPRWGRVVETYGEAPLLASDMGVATIAGFHGSLADQPGIPAPRDFGVATCLKHLIGYGAVQGGKDYAWVDLSERTMRELHLPPFAAGIAAGAPAIMPAFTTGPGGVPMTANRRVLQDIVRRELGFDGIFISDYAAVTEMRLHGTAADDLQAAVAALRDGTVTMDMEDGVYYAQLPRAVESGAVDEAQIRSRGAARPGLQAPPGYSGATRTCRRSWSGACGSRRRTGPRRSRSHAAAWSSEERRRAAAARGSPPHPGCRPAGRQRRRHARLVAGARQGRGRHHRAAGHPRAGGHGGATRDRGEPQRGLQARRGRQRRPRRRGADPAGGGAGARRRRRDCRRR